MSDANDLVPAREWLVSHMPARVRPPGDCAAYSNYNAMLAGYIVARVSGQPYDQYIQEHILDPLGMVHSTAQCADTAGPARAMHPWDTRMKMAPFRHSPITRLSRRACRPAVIRPASRTWRVS